MLRKIGAFSLGLLCLISTSSLVLSAEEAGGEGLSISELEQYAGLDAKASVGDVDALLAEVEQKLKGDLPYVAQDLLDKLQLADVTLTDAQKVRLADLRVKADKAVAKEAAQAAEKVGPAVSPADLEKAERLLQQHRQKLLVQQELDRKKAADLVQQAQHLLYTANRPAQASKLAEQAMLLDPTNKAAKDLKLEADVQLKISPAIKEKIGDQFLMLPNLRLQAAMQNLQNSIALAQQLYAEGRFAEAMAEWRRAETYVQLLSVSTDVSARAAQVQRGMATTEAAYREDQARISAAAKAEAELVAAGRIEEIRGREDQRRGMLVDEMERLIEEKKFDEASDIVNDLEYKDKSDELVPMYRKRIAEAEHRYTMGRTNAARESGDLRLDQLVASQETVPDRLFNYPDKEFWKNVVERREPVTYPSTEVALTPEDAVVQEQLQQKFTFSFQETPLDQVVEFLQQVTPPSYVLLRQDVPMDGAPVTLDVETTLEKALNHIKTLTGLSWKVEDGVIKIGSAESLRVYEMRVYGVRDLLISTEDVTSGTGQQNNNSRGGAGGTTGGSSTGFGGTGFQFGGDVYAQRSNRGDDDDDDDDEGYGDITDRAENLILLIKQACGTETWMSLSSTGLIDIGGDDDDDSGGGGTSNQDLPAELGGGTGFGAGGGGFGAPAAAGGFGMAEPMGMGMGMGGVQAGPAPVMPQGRAFIMANNPGDLLIVQSPEVHACIEALLKRLREQMRIQVQVDVRFLSVATDFLREVGFEWDNFSLDNNFGGPFGSLDGLGVSSGAYGGFVPFLAPAIGGTVLDPVSGTYSPVYGPNQFYLSQPFGDPGGTVDPTTGEITFTQTNLAGSPFIGTGIPFFESTEAGMSLNLGFGNEDYQLSGFFRMAQERKALRTLSAPQITLANGQRGFITVSTQSHYVSTYTVDEGVLVPTVASVADVADLTVRPVVSADRRYVFLELSPIIQTTDLTTRFDFRTFTGVAGGDTGGAAGAEVENFIALPRVLAETLATTVGVPDKGVIVVGGLSKASREQREAGVPVLNKIPILKRLFSAEGRSFNRETLFVLAKPEIIIFGTPDAEQDMRMQ